MRKYLSLYQKFAMIIIVAVLLPMGVLSTFMLNKMFREYKSSVESNYSQAVSYINQSVNDTIKNYDERTKMLYYYDINAEKQTLLTYGNYDNIRQILNEKKVQREEDMERFLQNVESADSSIEAVHFVGLDSNGEKIDFHYSDASTYFSDEQIFETIMNYPSLSRTTKQATLIPTHKTSYFYGMNKDVFTVARNYFNLTHTNEDGSWEYIGTIFIDVNIRKLQKIFEIDELEMEKNLVILNSKEEYFFNTDETSDSSKTENQITIESGYNEYGLKTMVSLETDGMFSRLRSLQKIIYIVLGVGVLVLTGGAVVFSKKLTKPIYNMMEQMSQIETGNFCVTLPITSNDEIGVLSKRFNQMSQELERYINQVYVAQIKQTEAEMTALKSQIYPHFLYNTLEVIRMTALEEKDEKVSEMIEALSVQIHYIIGTVQDMVPLKKEVQIVEKYIYLLNCRIRKTITFQFHMNQYAEILVPKLILQPIVENAYIHGIKPKDENGTICIEVEEIENHLVISVMDNGVGMDEETLKAAITLLNGEKIGIKNEYNWQSIGLKNVHDRIRYMYGAEYGVQISSSKMVGTIVSVVLPIKKEGDLN